MSLIGALVFDMNSPKEIIHNAFPVLDDRLWYITCYCFAFICAPYMNLLANRLTQSAYRKMLIIIGVLMSLVPTILMIDPFHVASKGYSAGWLIFMYMLGGYYKKYGFNLKLSKKVVWFILPISICTMVASLYAFNIFAAKTGMVINPSVLYDPYNSPLVLLNSILLLYLCVNMKDIHNGAVRKCIMWVSSVSLGVYIIHSHPVILDHVLINDNLYWTVNVNPLLTVLILLGLSMGVVLAAGALEQIRVSLFKLIGIDRLTKKIGNKMDTVLLVNV